MEVQTVTIDINTENDGFIHRLFPKTMAIIDRLHII